MKRGFRQYAVRSDTQAERRHVAQLAAIIYAQTGQDVQRCVDLAFTITGAVDLRITQEIEEANAEIESELRKSKQKGEEFANVKKALEEKGADVTEHIQEPAEGPDPRYGPGYRDK